MGVASECRANPRAYGPHEIPAPARPHGVSHGFMGVTSRHRPHRPRKHAASGGRRAPWLRSDVSRSEEHTSELQSLMRSSYAVFCLKKTQDRNATTHYTTRI